ncbi:MAG: hypothetical protein AMK73_08765, partial [Planctomycetes bacterium SM23_32]
MPSPPEFSEVVRETDIAVKALPEEALRHLASALGDRPETCLCTHVLRRGPCDAYVLGDPSRPAVAVIESPIWPGELITFGADAAALWAIVRRLTGWRILQADPTASGELADLIAHDTGGRIRTYDEVYNTLSGPAPVVHNDACRRLTAEDVGMPGAPLFLGEVLECGVAAGVVVDGR